MRKPVRLAAAVLVLLAGCATPPRGSLPGAQQQSGAQQQRTGGGAIVRGPALVEELLPARLGERRGWAEDMYAAMTALRVEPTAENVCAVIAIIEQESSFRVDPSIPGLPDLARRELDKRRERAGVPKVVAESALKLASSDGRTYAQRLDAATTERHLSDMSRTRAARPR